MSWYRRIKLFDNSPADPTGFLPGDMVIADNIPVKARPEPVRFTGGRIAMQGLPDVFPSHALLYLGYVDMKPPNSGMLPFRLLNFVWLGSICWISDDDAMFVSVDKLFEHDKPR